MFLKLVLLTLLFKPIFGGKFITVKLKKLTCESDPSVYNGTMFCQLKPTRNGVGNATGLYTFFEPANDIWYQMKVFYKFGNIYRPFMVDVDADLCGYFRTKTQIPTILQYLVKILLKDYPNVFHPCPYLGEAGFFYLDVDKMGGKIIPQVIPKGYYKILNRFHLKDNRTFATVTVEALVDAVDPLQGYEVG